MTDQNSRAITPRTCKHPECNFTVELSKRLTASVSTSTGPGPAERHYTSMHIDAHCATCGYVNVFTSYFGDDKPACVRWPKWAYERIQLLALRFQDVHDAFVDLGLPLPVPNGTVEPEPTALSVLLDAADALVSEMKQLHQSDEFWELRNMVTQLQGTAGLQVLVGEVVT